MTLKRELLSVLRMLYPFAHPKPPIVARAAEERHPEVNGWTKVVDGWWWHRERNVLKEGSQDDPL